MPAIFQVLELAMATSNVKLLGRNGCPFVNRAQMALNLKSIDHEFIQEDPFTKSKLLLKANPIDKKVPVLFHAETPISESLLIVQYIDEAWPNCLSILPSDPYERATTRFWAAYVDEKVSFLFYINRFLFSFQLLSPLLLILPCFKKFATSKQKF